MAGRTAVDKPAAAIAFGKVETGDLAQLRELKANNCHIEAWLRFARVPLITSDYATDLRFPAAPSGNFTTMYLADIASRPCERGIPGWDMPRADLLAPLARP